MRFLVLDARFYNAASSECFGNTQHRPADETTEFRPRSPYAVGKAASFWAVANYREAYGLFAGLRHSVQPRVARCAQRATSPKRSVRGAMDIAEGRLSRSSNWVRSISHAIGAGRPNTSTPCVASWTTRSRPTLVVATGETHSLKDFVAACFSCVQSGLAERRRHQRCLPSPPMSSTAAAIPRRQSGCRRSATTAMPRVVELLIEAELRPQAPVTDP